MIRGTVQQPACSSRIAPFLEIMSCPRPALVIDSCYVAAGQMEGAWGSRTVKLLIGNEEHVIEDVHGYEDLLRAARERSGGADGDAPIIMDTNRTPVTTVNYEEVRQHMDTFMVQPSVNGVSRTSISYQPHYRTLTDAGKAHFSDIAYAVADLVDNSIQAAQEAFEENGKQGAKKVEVSVFLSSSQSDSSYLVVWDNGCGMDVQRIQAFATYFLGQEDRGLAPTGDEAGRGTLTSRISKFGVGAIHAGFYIGTRVKVLTRTNGSRDVRSFVLDEASLQERYASKSTLYKDDVLSGDCSISWMLTPDEAKCQGLAQMVRDKLGQPHGTAVILTMRAHHAMELLRDQGRALTRKLAHLYHYYANPSSCPVFNINEALTQGALGKRRAEGVGDNGKAKRRKGQDGDAMDNVIDLVGATGQATGGGGAAREDAVDLTINLVKGHAKTTYDFTYHLSEQDPATSLEARFLSLAKSQFRFSFELEDPSGAVSEEGLPPFSQREIANGDTRRPRPKYKVNGIIYYYPYENYTETRPSMLDLEEQSDSENEDGTTGNGGALGRSGSNGGQSQRYRTEEETFDVFWQGRLIPETKVASLPFFPANKAQWEGKLPRNYMCRLHGTLFFDDWQFPVSTNKLKLLIDLKAAFKERGSVVFNKRQLSDDFLKWLIECHKRFDKELEFVDKIGVQRDEEGNVRTRFATIRYGHGEDAVYRKGDKVRLWVKAGRGTKEVYGIVQFFSVPTEVLTNTFVGDGDIVIKKHPVRIHGDVEVTESLRTLQYDRSKVDQAAWDAYEDSHLKKQPHDIVVLTYDKDEKKRRPLHKRFQLESGEQPDFLKVIVGVVDREGNYIGKKASSVYKVVEEMTGPEVFRYESVQPGVENRYHYFNSYWNCQPGDYQLKFSVWEDAKMWHEKVFHYTVVPSTPVSFTLDPAPLPLELPLVESIALPPFTLKLKDKHGNNTTSTVNVRITCDELDIGVRGSKSQQKAARVSTLSGAVEDVNGLVFEEGDWLACPKDLDTPLLGTGEIGSRTVTLTVLVDELGPEAAQTFTVTLTPGPPRHMRITDPPNISENEPLEVENFSPLPPMVLCVYDVNHNLTAPSRGENWVVKVSGEGLVDTSFADQPSQQSKRSSSARDRVRHVDTNGKCALLNLKVDAPWEEDSEVSKSQDCALARTLSLRFCRRGDAAPIELHIPLRVTPSTRPCKLVIYQGDRPLTQTEAVVGSVLDGLSVRVLDQRGQRVELDPEVDLGHKTAGLRASWSTKAVPFPRLPPLTVDKTASKTPKEYQVVLSLHPATATPPIITDLAFRLVAGPPASWDLKHLEADAELTSGLPPKEVPQIIVRDAFNNRAVWDKDSCPHPLVAFDGNSVTTHPPHESFQLEVSARGRILFPSDFHLVGPAQELTIKVYDLEGRLSAKTLSVTLKGGAPCVLELCCPALGIKNFHTAAEGAVHNNQQVSGVKLRMLDAANNVVTDFPPNLEIVPVLSEDPSRKGKARQLPVIPVRAGHVEKGEIDFPAFTYKPKSLEKRDLTVTLRMDGNHDLCKATLTCKTLRLNRVTSLRASWDPLGQRNPEHFLPWDGEIVKADASPLPNLIIKLLTEDEREYICDPTNLVLTCQRDKEKDLDFYAIFKPPIVAELMEKPVFQFEPLPGARLCVGEYSFTYTYTETREAIKNAIGESELVLQKPNAFALTVKPGDPASLEPVRGDAPLGKVVTNRSDRTVVEDLTLVCKDRLGNPSPCPHPLTLTLRPAAETGEVAASDRPRLHGTHGEGPIVIRADEEGQYAVPKVRLMEGVGSQEGSYEIVFSVPGVESYCVGFTFSTDTKRIKEINGVTQRLEGLKRKRQKRAETLSSLEARRRRADDAIRQLHSKIPVGSDVRRLFVGESQSTSTAMPSGEDLHFPSHRDVDRELSKVARTLEDMRNSPCRATTMVQPPKEFSSFAYMGTVVSLGFVKDPAVAKLLSTHIGTKIMNTLVFEDRKTQQAFADKHQTPTFSIETMTPWTTMDNHGKKRVRSKREKESGAIPYPKVKAQGDPRWAVNEIDLPEEQEDLRDTLFKSILGRCLVFDTRDNAMLYKSQCRQRLQEAGTLITMDGWKVAASGLLEKLPQDCPVVFGEMPVTKTKSYRFLERDGELLRKLQELVQEREAALEELQGAQQDDDAGSDDREMRELNATLKKLRALSQQEAEVEGEKGGGRRKSGRMDVDEIEDDEEEEEEEAGPKRSKKRKK